ncbi:MULTISPECIES: hypothetical protein [unclassified Streptomyces]|uniref:hypothetical protein n=1 Tax=unclassified Streptomyces TaxID=2593676 RepID=UPI0040429AAE
MIDKFIGFRMVHLGVTRTPLAEAFRLTHNRPRKDIARQTGETPIVSYDHSGTFSVQNVLIIGVPADEPDRRDRRMEFLDSCHGLTRTVRRCRLLRRPWRTPLDRVRLR